MYGIKQNKKTNSLKSKRFGNKEKKNSFVLVGTGLDTCQVNCIRNSGITFKSAYLRSDRSSAITS